jgi:hypothetical protein
VSDRGRAPLAGLPLRRPGPRRFLLDGFVGGTWKIERTRGAVPLVIEPFEPLPDEAREALLEEGERLIRFVEDDAEALEVRLSR